MAATAQNVNSHQNWVDYCESGEATPVNLHDEGTLANLTFLPSDDRDPIMFFRTLLITLVLGVCAWYGIYRIIKAVVN
jgi:hypothetical protein